MSKRFLAIGECMVELAQAGENTYRRGFAGDTFNTAWYARRLLPDDWTVSYASCIGADAVSDEMAAFMHGEGIDTSSLRRVEGRTVGLLDISKPRGDLFLDHVGANLRRRGAEVVRYKKPTFTKPAPVDLRHEIAVSCDAVVEALAD